MCLWFNLTNDFTILHVCYINCSNNDNNNNNKSWRWQDSGNTVIWMLLDATMAPPPWFVKPMLSSFAMVGNGRERSTIYRFPSGRRRLCWRRLPTVWQRQLCCLTTALRVCRTWDGTVVRRHDMRCVPGAGWTCTCRQMLKRRPWDAKMVMCQMCSEDMMETLLVDFQRSQK